MEHNDQAKEPITPYNQPLDFDKVWLMFMETDKQFKETDKRIKETEKLIAERSRESDRRIKKLDQLFTSQWGKLVESLVEGDLIKLLKANGISVERTVQRVDGNYKGQNFEFDIIAINGSEIVIVEIKTTLRQQDVTHFHEKLFRAKDFLPEYRDKVKYGAVAFITSEGASHRMAENLGLFVIRATGNSSSIINKKDFKPQKF